MALVNRIARLFKADFHAVLDQLEEPEQLLRQSIRDMEDEIDAGAARVADANGELAELAARRAELAATIGRIDGELDLCFESGRDELARSLVCRKLEAERLAKHVASRIMAAETWLDDFGRQMREQREALESLKQKADVFASVTSPRRHPDRGNDRLACDAAIGDDEIEIALLREKAARTPA